jgi:hypothetical protein
VTALAGALALTLLAAEPATDVYAIVIGHNGGLAASADHGALPPLRFADDDALKLARSFAALPGHQRTWVLARPDEATRAVLEKAALPLPQLREPTRAALFAARDELKALLAERPAGRRAVVYLFYAGHGVTGRLLLEPEAGQAEASLTGQELKLLAASLPADDVDLFVDACRAQSLFTSRGEVGPDLSARLEQQLKQTRLGVLAAAQTHQPAGETDRLQGGFFSHVLASGLLGGADSDGDEVVRFGELAAFVAFHTERLTGQRPWFEPPEGGLKVEAVRLAGATRLRLGEDTEGRVQVVSTAGVPYFAEVNKARGRAVRLALPVGRYQVVRRASDGARASAEVDLASGEEHALGAAAFGAVLASAERGGEDEGFVAPFGPEVVATLDVGYHAGREPSVAVEPWRDAVDLAYLGSPAPFGLGAVEHGVELGYRRAFGNLLLGPRLSYRATPLAGGALQRLGAMVQGGWRFYPLGWLEVSPWLAVGFKSVWSSREAAPFSPSLGAGGRVSVALTRHFSVFLDVRYEGAWVTLDGESRPFGEPAALVGVSLWR